MPDKKQGDVGIDFGMELSFDDLGLPKVTFTDVKPDEAQAVMEISKQFQASVQPATSVTQRQLPHKPASPLLSVVINDFMQDQAGFGIDEMMKKHRLVLPLFLHVLGDKPVSEIKQADITNFFDTVNHLPKYWQYDIQKGLSIEQIIALPDRVGLAEWTFTGTYRASVASLLGWAVTERQDDGFPTTLTTDRIKYKGDRKKGKQQKQRAFSIDELKRIFEGTEMQSFASNPELLHQYWLLHIALHTGARINEICQMNPQTDIRQDPDGIWHFLITEETEAHEDVIKTVKMEVTREVPIHKALLELGFLDYVNGIKATGEKLLFPAWKPKGGRAGTYAGEWFTDFLKDIGIYGVKNERGNAVRGAHAFRHTLLSHGKADGRNLNLRCISGHKERSDNEVADGYEDDTIIRPLAEKQCLLDALDYGIVFHKPVSPAGA